MINFYDMERDSIWSNITERTFNAKSKQFKNLGICQKDQCLKQIPKRLPPLRLPTAEDEDVWEVKALPVNWSIIWIFLKSLYLNSFCSSNYQKFGGGRKIGKEKTSAA